MNIKQRLLSLSVCCAALSSSVPAFAGFDICPEGYFCIWGDSNYNGRWQILNQGTGNIGNFMNDLTTSYWNRTGHTWCGYEHSNFEGISLPFIPGDSSPNIGGWFNDRFSSFRPC